MFKIAAKYCFLRDTHRLIYFTGKATTVLSSNRTLSVKGNNSSSFLCGEEINCIVFEIIITTVCAITSCEKLSTDKSATEQLSSGKRGSIPYYKQASGCVVRHYQEKVSTHLVLIAVLLLLLLILKVLKSCLVPK